MAVTKEDQFRQLQELFMQGAREESPDTISLSFDRAAYQAHRQPDGGYTITNYGKAEVLATAKASEFKQREGRTIETLAGHCAKLAM